MKKNAHPATRDTISVIDATAITREIAASKANIQKFQDAIGDIFVELGYAEHARDVRITVGPEIEVTQVAGAASWERRTQQMKAQMRDPKHSGSFNLNSKDDNYMPARARIASLNRGFVVSGIPSARRVLVELEPTFKGNLGTRFKLRDTPNGTEQFQKLCAFSQIEFTSPPRSPVGAAAWINRLMDNSVNAINLWTLDRKRAYGLKQLDFTAHPHDETAPNSIHLNSVITVGGKNAFSAKEWGNEERLGIPSDLLLCVGKAHMEYLKHSIFLFARAESDYPRLQPEEVSGPTFIAIPARKKHGEFSTAMFRGEERETERTNSAYPHKKDGGPMRFELRVPCPGAAGHPNKLAYPEQNALAYQMVEAYMQVIYNGVKLWRERELARAQGKTVSPMQEEDFSPCPASDCLPRNKWEAVERFMAHEEAQDYWGSRTGLLCRLSQQLDEINTADRNPYSREKGPHVHRR